MVKLVNTRDLNSLGPFGPCRFKSGHPHQSQSRKIRLATVRLQSIISSLSPLEIRYSPQVITEASSNPYALVVIHIRALDMLLRHI